MNTSSIEPQSSVLPRGELMLYIGTMIVLTVLGVFSNGYLVLLFAKYKQLRSNSGIYFIMLLAVCELLSCLGRLAQTSYNFAYVASNYMLVISSNTCVPMLIMSMPTFGVTQIAHFALTVDRYFAVHCPLEYHGRDHLLTVQLAALLLAFYAAVQSSAIVLEHPVTLPMRQFCRLNLNGLPFTWALLLGVGLFTGVGMILLSVALMLKMKKTFSHIIGLVSESQQAQKHAREKSVTWTVIIVALMYTCTWFIPNIFLIIFSIVGGDHKSDATRMWQSRAERFIGVTSAVNSCANIFVYAWRHPDLSKYIRRHVTGNTGTGSFAHWT